MSTSRGEISRRKLASYRYEFSDMQEKGFGRAYRLIMPVVSAPLLLIDILVLLLTGRDLRWFDSDFTTPEKIVPVRMTAAKLLERLEPMRRPAIEIREADGTPGFSKLGGRPDVAPGFEWPRWRDQPLSFLAQIDLAALPQQILDFSPPGSGRLYFFYDVEQSTWGFDPADAGSWQVLYVDHDEPLSPAAFPEDLPEHGRYAAKPVSFSAISTLPDVDRLDLDPVELSDADWDEVYNASDPTEGPGHRIGGYPRPIQDDEMEAECQLASNGYYCGRGQGSEHAAFLAANPPAWQLLLQLDSDDDCDMMWGDLGTLYFWIREADLARRDFSQVWMILQCS